MEHQTLHVHVAVQQRHPPQPQLDLARGEHRPIGGLRLADAHVVADQPVNQAQPHAGKFQVHALFVQRRDQAGF